MDDSPHITAALNLARSAKVVVAQVWFWRQEEIAPLIPKDIEHKTIFLSDDIHHKRCNDSETDLQHDCGQMKLEEINMWKERRGLWVSITDEDSCTVQKIRPETLLTDTLPYLAEMDPHHRLWTHHGSIVSNPGMAGSLRTITIVYTGGPHEANLIAIGWFISTALKTFVDLIGSSATAKVHLIITGRGWGYGWDMLDIFDHGTAKPEWLSEVLISFTEVDDVAATILACDAVIVPDRATSSGVSTKTFQPIVHGVPFVATSLARRGISCPPEADCDHLFFCPLDDPEGMCFANRLFAVVTDPEFVKQQQSALETLRSANGYQRWLSRPIFQSFLNDHLALRLE